MKWTRAQAIDWFVKTNGDDPGSIAALAALARDLQPERITQLSINPEDVQVTMDGSLRVAQAQGE